MLLSAPDTILPAILLPRHRFLHDIIRHELREKGLWAGLGDSEVEWKVVRNHHKTMHLVKRSNYPPQLMRVRGKESGAKNLLDHHA